MDNDYIKTLQDKRKQDAEDKRRDSQDEILKTALLRDKTNDLGRRGKLIASALSEALDSDDEAMSGRHGELLQAIKELTSSVESQTSLYEQQSDAIKETYKDMADKIESVVSTGDATQSTVLKQILSAVKNPPLMPVPQVTVSERDIDLSDLLKAIKDLKPKETKKLSLSDFKANDIDTAPDGTQYISFMALDGTWYIVHADEDSMRFYFSKGDYESAWGERHGHEYKNLAEAARNVAT